MQICVCACVCVRTCPLLSHLHCKFLSGVESQLQCYLCMSCLPSALPLTTPAQLPTAALAFLCLRGLSHCPNPLCYSADRQNILELMSPGVVKTLVHKTPSFLAPWVEWLQGSIFHTCCPRGTEFQSTTAVAVLINTLNWLSSYVPVTRPQSPTGVAHGNTCTLILALASSPEEIQTKAITL